MARRSKTQLKQVAKLPTTDNNFYKVIFIAEDTQYFLSYSAPSCTPKMSENTQSTTNNAAKRKWEDSLLLFKQLISFTRSGYKPFPKYHPRTPSQLAKRDGVSKAPSENPSASTIATNLTVNPKANHLSSLFPKTKTRRCPWITKNKKWRFPWKKKSQN